MQRLPGLDLLRAIAIAWVMLFHSFLVGGFDPGWDWLAYWGWMGVDLFFVLSGFLIGTQVLRQLVERGSLDFRNFYVRRIFRVLPAYFTVLGLYFLVPAFREEPGIQPLWQFLTFSLNFLIDYAHNRAFSHAWSLCVEEHFYLVFPLAAVLLGRRLSLRGLVMLSVAIVAGGIAIRACVWLYDMAPVSGVATAGRSFSQRFVEDMYYPTYNRLDGLLAGVMLAAIKVYRPLWWERLQLHANGLLIAGLAMMAGILWLFVDRVGFLPNVIGFPLLSVALALLVAAGAGTHSWIACWKVPGASWLASISYSLYLIHKGMIHLASLAFGEYLETQGFLAFCTYAAAAFIGGALLHWLVERPSLRWRERWLRAGPSAANALPVAAA
jgi:peptidoglycan/LPS O-acetylase OafA/YrhL